MLYLLLFLLRVPKLWVICMETSNGPRAVTPQDIALKPEKVSWD